MNAKQRPVLIVIAGPNGSGKTSFTEQALKHGWTFGCEYVNPDLIAQNEFGDWNSPEAVLKAAQRADAIREQCLREGRSLMFETVFSTLGKLQFLHRASKTGFFIRLFFIGTADPSINVRRVARRVLEGGHDVPEDRLRQRYYRSINNLLAGLYIADRGYVYDNSIDDAPERLLFRTRKDTVEKVYVDDLPEWAAHVLEALHSYTLGNGPAGGR